MRLISCTIKPTALYTCKMAMTKSTGEPVGSSRPIDMVATQAARPGSACRSWTCGQHTSASVSVYMLCRDTGARTYSSHIARGSPKWWVYTRVCGNVTGPGLRYYHKHACAHGIVRERILVSCKLL